MLRSNARLLVTLLLGALVIVLLVDLNSLGRSSVGLMAQAFQSPVETPTHPPYPPPGTPTPSQPGTPTAMPTPPGFRALEEDGDALLDFFEKELEFQDACV